ncbi:hybrid sensor histidine kinase/response regulator [Leptolyngbya sp. NK1-12]|uniref:histidine kinase n=1 Tax=Leptolyngbya sp. NK1-12 TaxID=2547451 RepID=A0AA97AQL5_9CYAN|nr:hybrid sensor histidine kinase/response regulator [Leptolyngbya sp. NK1-12]WNZ23778.1 hybrid sensor histidine kinase/response regulator [Leptolyngbya sp. NK1-12]
MLSPDIRDQAYQFFIEEAPELLEGIESGLLRLRQGRTTADVHELMRAAHSIKGGAASVQLDLIKTIAHRLETIFKALYDDSVAVDLTLESQLLEAYDCLRLPLIQQIEMGYVDAEQALTKAEAIFAQLENRLAASLAQADGYIPTSSDLGVDMVGSIFEIDVAQGLERFSAVLQQPDAYPVAGELQAQAEVFMGLAELLDLPGFAAIAQTALTALETHPDQALRILQLAYADFIAGREAVLQGDRTQGGTPSAELLALTDADYLDPSQPGNDRSDHLFDKSSENSQDDLFDNLSNLASVFSEELIDRLDLEELTALDFIERNIQTDTAVDTEIYAEKDNLIDVEADHPLVPEAAPFQELFGIEPELNSTPVPVPIDAASVPTEQPEVELFPEKQEGDQTSTELSLDMAVRAAEQLFDQLPALADEIQAQIPDFSDNKSVAASAPEEETNWKQYVRPTQTGKSTPSTSTNLTIRVDLHRLERMNNLVSELAINRNSLSLQHEQLQAAVRDLGERFEQFQSLIERLREVSDRMLVATADRSSPQLGSSDATSTLLAGFDTLEMDRYSTLHFQLQEIWEQVIQLEEGLEDVGLFAGQSNQTLTEQRQKLTQLQNELMWARMLPLGNVLNRFPRVLRDLSAKYNKSVSLKLSGTSVLVDKMVLEKLYDPLLHLLRNAFDHGIETPEIRQQRGKPEQGSIEIRAYHRGNQTLIDIVDDGQGIDVQRISKRAVELGWLSAEALETAKPTQLLDFIFEPGFSTASQVSELSGRGVGLDVVRSQVRALKGSLSVNSRPGQGTTFTLRIPLTLTIAKLLTCLVNATPIAVPADSIEEILVPKAEQLKQTGSQRFLHWRSQLVPMYRLADLLHYACPLPENSIRATLSGSPAPKEWAMPILVIQRAQHSFALEVDRLITEQELVIKPFGAAIAPPAYTYGCTILSDGSLVPVIDAATLVDLMLDPSSGTSATHTALAANLSSSRQPMRPSALSTRATQTILVVDDSATLRRMLALTLEKSGYRVLQARDGQEALSHLQQSSSVQLVICDIEMPNMNGFEFLSQRRQDPNLTAIPVVILTSRNNEKHRRLAMHLGATTYFSKPYIEHELLDALKHLLVQS